MKTPKHPLVTIGILACAYFVAGKLGLSLAFVNPSATAVWPPAGIALAAFLVLGYRVWPGILVGAFLVNLTTAGSVGTSIGIATGNTLEGLLGAYLVKRFAGGRHAFDRAKDTFRFAILAGMFSTTVSATFGVTSLLLGGFASWDKYGAVWLTWWLGDAVSDLVVAPVLMLWGLDARVRWKPVQFLEFVVLIASLVVIVQIVFGGLFPLGVKDYPLEYMCIPVLVWGAFRFGQRQAAIATFVLSGLAIWGTLHGFGPFVRVTQNESLILLQTFMGVVAVMSMALAAVVAERERAEEQTRQLAVSDPLTGLANYRKLIDVLDSEISRSSRTGRPISLLLLDLDELKSINDRHGHLAGTQALRRVAKVLAINCREMDTAARYGGDEFVVVLPEAAGEVARGVALRISERLAHDNEEPRISVSIGVAAYPEDGETIESLLGAADRALYEMKRRPRPAHDVRVLQLAGEGPATVNPVPSR